MWARITGTGGQGTSFRSCILDSSQPLEEGLARLNQKYEHELMNPKEALSLGSVSSIVMPGDSRRVLGENLAYLMRHYRPEPMSGVQREHE